MQNLLIQIGEERLKDFIASSVSEAMQKFMASLPEIHPVKSKDRLLTKKEAAAYLKVSLPTLSKYVKDGYVKAHTVAGTRMRFLQTDLDKALVSLRSR